ncbi:MAG TPA: S26 family signal peptidase [Tepidisphaeraceae bacterium]|jgi:signal peptidase I
MSVATAQAAHVRKPDAGVKETIESILIAFILAFIFRCFVVEAFVIPTGSMAPTLMGAHLQFRCPDCGYRFAAGYPDQDDNFSVPERANKTYGVFCPNCGLRVSRRLPDDAENDAETPIIRYGDRILVMKYLYLLHPAQRWDVVVFKTPDNRGSPGDFSVNYIKRLIGRPGERLFVAEGDVFVSPDTGQAPKETDFIVQTKPRPAQDALWRIVYDADYVPVGLPRTYQASSGADFADPVWKQPWQAPAGSGWINNDQSKGVSARSFVFDNRAGNGALTFNRDAIPNTAPLTDWLAYDQTSEQRITEHDSLDRPSYATQRGIVKNVADLKLSATVDRFAGEGHLSLVVGKTDDAEFAAEVTETTVRLIKRLPSSSRTIGEIARPSGRFTLAIQNVDYRVVLSIDGHERLATTTADYSPDVTAIVRRARERTGGPAGYCRIEADHCTTALSHLQLWRDVYYRDSDRDVIRGIAHDFPEKIVTLGADEYFTMGDNSYQSSDGRYWTSVVDLPDEGLKAEAGIVPGRFMLGKAFFVYWPAGFRAYSGTPPLVPNFGEMRFIR